MISDGAGITWLLVAFGLILVALLLWLISKRSIASTGLPTGRIIYSDDGSWIPLDEPLFSEELNLVGRPDYVVVKGDGTIIPVEIKSSLAPNQPTEGHIMQLAAYCFLVEQNFGSRPPYGILQYRDQAYAVEYSYELEEDLETILEDMYQDMMFDKLDRDHEEWFRCQSCHFSTICNQSLV